MSKFFISSLIFVLFARIVSAQSFTISGLVSDDKGPLKDVIVRLKEIDAVTTTRSNGSFTFNKIPSGNYTLMLSSVGYLKQNMNVTVNEADITLPEIRLKRDFLQLEQIVVTGTRNEVLRKDAPIVCNVLDDRIFNATQSVTLSEGLNFQPALRIENNCQNCGFNSLRMNGLEGAYTQVLIDGRPIYNSLQGVYGLEQIPSNMIERVEVVRSGGSALYGSSAVAGTVNIITREPDKNSYYLNTNQSWINGSTPDRTYLLGAEIVNENRTGGLAINGFNRDRGFWDSNGDGFSEIGRLKSNALNIKAYYKPTRLSRLSVNGYSIYEFRRGGNKFDKVFHETDITEATTHNILNGGITYEQFTQDEKHKFSLYANAQNLTRDSYYGGGQDLNAYGNSLDNSLVSGIQYSGKLGRFAGGNHTIVSGIEYNRNALNDNAPAYDRFIRQVANQTAFYLQDIWKIANKFNVLLGGRVDRHNFIKAPIISPRANLSYKINPYLNFRVGYARGFRAPQVFDEDLHITQVGGGGAVVRNSSNLTPEYSNAYSSSIDFNKYSDDWAIGLTTDGFYTRLQNVFIIEEIGNTTGGDLLLERRNGPGATVAGVTFNPKVVYKEKVSLQLGFTLQKSNYQEAVQWSDSIVNTSTRFFRTPNQYGFYTLRWDALENFAVNLSGVYTGSMLAPHYAGYIDNDVLEITPSLLENNVKTEYRNKLRNNVNLTISAGIQNFTNAYQKDFDLGPNRDSAYIYGPGRPRTYFLGMGLNF